MEFSKLNKINFVMMVVNMGFKMDVSTVRFKEAGHASRISQVSFRFVWDQFVETEDSILN